MKKLLLILTIAIFLFSCEKEYGTKIVYDNFKPDLEKTLKPLHADSKTIVFYFNGDIVYLNQRKPEITINDSVVVARVKDVYIIKD